MLNKKNSDLLSQVLMACSVVSVFLSGVGYLGTDIWLASTQWLLVSAVMALFGVYLRLNR